MTESVAYESADRIAVIRIDDGKRNALSPEVLAGLNAALDRAEAEGATVILTGRESVFSAGFDLKVMGRGGARAIGMLRAGYSLTARVLEYPHPVIVACGGHAMAMGVFLLLCADHRIGTRGEFKISANEVAIGMPMPRAAASVLEHRLAPAAYQRAVTLAHHFDVESAHQAGFFDEVADVDGLMPLAQQRAREFAALDDWAHKVSKRQIRRSLTGRIRRQIPLDLLAAIQFSLRASRARRKTLPPAE
ncbi:MAG: crotonase/enoyl-CoA hydratase family protein [Pseudomonadota bacterium]